MKNPRIIYRLASLLLLLASTSVRLTAQVPSIEKIDPPGWWSTFPDPMLLVHGEHLDNAKFTVNGRGVQLTRTQVSANGHWALLWLDTHAATAQTLNVIAANAEGQTSHTFQLSERSHDPNAHRGFSASDVLYQIMPDRFADGDLSNNVSTNQRSLPRGWHGGNFAGIEQHIDYLQQLGVTALWLTPVVSNGAMPDSYHGYAATDLYAIDAHFGTLAQYQQLSRDLHARGIKLVFDLVPNHLGLQHPWVLDPPAPEWFHGTVQNHHSIKDRFDNLVDPHAPPAAWRDVTNGWFTDAMPDLNQENPLVSRYLIQNALWWVETAGLDGLRIDTFPYVGRGFWHDFHAVIHSVYPQLTTVGEVFNRDAEITSFFAGGVAQRGIDTGLDTPFDFPVYFALRDVLAQDKPMTELAAVLRQDALYPHPERLVTFIGNHDTSRFITSAGGFLPRLKLALGLVATLRGMPQIYSGDEIGMSGADDPDNRHDFPGGFSADAHSAFTPAGRTAAEQEAYSWTAGLIALRQQQLALQTGAEQNLFADADAIVFLRTTQDTGCPTEVSAPARFLVVVNKSHNAKHLDILTEDTALAGCTQFRVARPTTGNTPALHNGKLSIEEPAESMTIFEVR
ncbi:MAG TPA: alpha-amylase family glycosyl hydrolase [Terracidiphilus sp.]|nr:alpha-amylase family glycosyl hydrolase [Terracidiphilus sp.]